MFADDVDLVRTLTARYAATGPFVEPGGLARPCLADYRLTVEAMAHLRGKVGGLPVTDADIIAAQRARYLDIENPLGFLGDVELQNPETGGLPIERLHQKYPRTIGTAILLSVLEHVADPFDCARQLHAAMRPGGLVICSVPWQFPSHAHGGEDNYRFSPTGLRHVFAANRWTHLESGWRLDIPAEAGVIDLSTGRAQIIQSAYYCGRAI